MIPKDPNILFSYINTKLRDEYSTLDEFCKSNMCDSSEICARLEAVGYIYSREQNKFILK